jgi:hypothetical protein
MWFVNLHGRHLIFEYDFAFLAVLRGWEGFLGSTTSLLSSFSPSSIVCSDPLMAMRKNVFSRDGVTEDSWLWLMATGKQRKEAVKVIAGVDGLVDE